MPLLKTLHLLKVMGAFLEIRLKTGSCNNSYDGVQEYVNAGVRRNPSSDSTTRAAASWSATKPKNLETLKKVGALHFFYAYCRTGQYAEVP